MKTSSLFGILLAVGASLTAAQSAQAENAMYSCTDPSSGAVSLTNVPQGQCEQLFTYAAPADAPAAAPAATVAAAPVPAGIVAEIAAPPASAPASKTASLRRPSTKPLIAQRRDDAIQQTREAYAAGQPSVVGNPATNRRYLMTNRVDYQRSIGMIP